MSRKATIKDVASAAGVSVAAVSRYLNGSIRLPPATTKRIDQAVAALRYVPNPLARSLSRGRSDTIGLVVPEISNPFFAGLAAAVETAAAEHGLGVLLCVTLNRVDRELDYIRRLEHRQVDGLLFATNHPDDGTLLTALAGLPGMVLVDEDIAGAEVSGVFAENVAGAYDATRHILAAGHRRIAMLSGPPGLLTAEERRRGFMRAVSEAGAQALAVMEGAYTREAGEAATERLLADHPQTTAIFTGSDEIFLGMLQTFRRRGIRIGTDISVVTCDDVEPLGLFEPPITALRQDLGLLAREALRLVMREIATPPSGAGRVRVPMELQVRQSVLPPRRRVKLG
ncbi:LacI family DNA-binding transcriptional regulator [Acidisoma sp. C75]